MPNANTIDRLVGAASPAQGRKAIPSFAPGATTTAMIVTDQTGSAAIVGPGVASIASGFSAPTTGAVNFDGFAFKVRMVGRVTTTGSSNITFAIAQGNTTTYASGNVIGTSSSTAVNTTSATCVIECNCVWDSVTQKLNGWQIGNFNNTLITGAALTNQVSVTAMSSLNFVVAVTSSGASTATFYIDEFTMEAV